MTGSVKTGFIDMIRSVKTGFINVTGSAKTSVIAFPKFWFWPLITLKLIDLSLKTSVNSFKQEIQWDQISITCLVQRASYVLPSTKAIRSVFSDPVTSVITNGAIAASC